MQLVPAQRRNSQVVDYHNQREEDCHKSIEEAQVAALQPHNWRAMDYYNQTEEEYHNLKVGDWTQTPCRTYHNVDCGNITVQLWLGQRFSYSFEVLHLFSSCDAVDNLSVSLVCNKQALEWEGVMALMAEK